jgi:hypothetical protein
MQRQAWSSLPLQSQVGSCSIIVLLVLSYGLAISSKTTGFSCWGCVLCVLARTLHQQQLHCKELQDAQIVNTMQQNAALTLLDGAPATMADHC